MTNIKNNIKVDIAYRFFSFLDFTSAIWVLYLASKGMSLLEIGLLEGIFHGVSLICEIPTGAIADLLGRKKSLVLGRLMALTSSIIMLFSNSFWGFALGFTFSALSYNLNSGAEEALIYDTLKELNEEEKYHKIISKLNVVIEVTYGIAVLLGGILAERDFALAYAAAAIVSLTALSIALLFKEPNYKSNKEEKINIKKHLTDGYVVIKNNKELRYILLFYPLVSAFGAVSYFYGQSIFSSIGLSTSSIALIVLAKSAFGTIGAINSEKVTNLLRNKTTFIMVLGIALAIIFFGGFNGVIGILCFISIGFFETVLQPISSSLINSRIPSEQRATILSVESMSYSIIMIGIFPIIGALGDSIGLSKLFIILGIVLIIINFCALRANRKINSK